MISFSGFVVEAFHMRIDGIVLGCRSWGMYHLGICESPDNIAGSFGYDA